MIPGSNAGEIGIHEVGTCYPENGQDFHCIATTQLAAKLLYWQFGPDNLINIKILDTDSNFTYIVPVMA